MRRVNRLRTSRFNSTPCASWWRVRTPCSPGSRGWPACHDSSGATAWEPSALAGRDVIETHRMADARDRRASREPDERGVRPDAGEKRLARGDPAGRALVAREMAGIRQTDGAQAG